MVEAGEVLIRIVLQWGRDLLVAERYPPGSFIVVLSSFNGAATC